MKTNKIQVSTVRKIANVQVIELNAAFVARVVEAKIVAKNVISRYEKMLEDEEGYTTHELVATKINLNDTQLLSNLLEDINAAFVANDEQDDDQDCETTGE